MAGPIVHVVGARPNFVKAAPVIAALTSLQRDQRVVHTGQHYDASMSDVFFDELGLAEPDLHLGVGSGSHASQTARLLTGLEGAFETLGPSVVVVYGDVNSTLAAALVAAKLGLPIAHVEAGLRSFDDTMPEEINRRVTDLLSTLCYTTSPEAAGHLTAMGVPASAIRFVGNPMIDTLLANLHRLDPGPISARLGLPERYGVVTLHRPGNVDDPTQAARIVAMLAATRQALPLVFPIHPRSRPPLTAAGLPEDDRLRLVDPLGYVDFLSLVRGATVAITDSGGIQEETTVLGVPCLTVRPNTERPITISHGTNRLVRPEDVPGAVAAILAGDVPAPRTAPPLWDGHAGPRIATDLAEWLDARSGPVGD